MNQHSSNIQSQGRRRIFGEIEEIEDEIDIAYNSFKNFRVVDNTPSDHHYLTQTQNALMKLKYGQAFRRRMEEEWRFLEEQIPSSIFVRAFEHRIDLMRAAFLGQPGSDYQHCLFFFDIFFPVNYPDAPPMIHYLSSDDPVLDLNPNLQNNRRACLDVIETCFDLFKKTWSCISSKEKSGPKQFDVMHLLHAMQNQISRHSTAPSHSSSNAKVFFSACEMMIGVLKKPPMGFEFLVAGHFRRVSHQVLLKFKENEYRNKIMISLFKRMFRVFEENGSYCKHHLDFLR